MLSESDLCVRLRTLKRGESSLGLWLPAKDLSRITVLRSRQLGLTSDPIMVGTQPISGIGEWQEATYAFPVDTHVSSIVY